MRLLGTLDRLRGVRSSRTARDVDAELRSIRGARREPAELAAQEELFPRGSAVAFGPAEAETAARLYRVVRKPRGREIDLAIAALAIVHDAALWTLNPSDFKDVPDLRLV